MTTKRLPISAAQATQTYKMLTERAKQMYQKGDAESAVFYTEQAAKWKEIEKSIQEGKYRND